MTNLFKKISLFFIGFLLLVSFAILIVLWTFSKKYPDYKFFKNYKPPVSSKVYSGNGEQLQIFQKKKEYSYHIVQYQKMLLILFYLQRIKIFFLIQELMQKVYMRAIIKNIQIFLLQKD